DTLIEHRIRDFDESGNVRAHYKVARMPVLLSSSPRVLVDGGHDMTKTGIDFRVRPWQPHRVLAHLQTGRRHTTRICCLTGAKKDFSLEEQIDTRGDSRHVGRF